MRPHTTRRRLFFLHRYLGIIAALFIILLSGTGLLLNHTDRLGLDKRHVESGWLLDLYGIRAPDTVHAYLAGGHWISLWDRRLFVDQQILADNVHSLRGAAAASEYIIIATDETLWLLDKQLQLIEQLGSAHGLPGAIDAIGEHDKQLLVKTQRGVFHVELDTAQWSPLDSERNVAWSKAERMPPALYDTVFARYRSSEISWERLLLDLHSGRLFGDIGVVLIDAAAILFLVLAGTGIGLFFSRPSKPPRRTPPTDQH